MQTCCVTASMSCPQCGGWAEAHQHGACTGAVLCISGCGYFEVPAAEETTAATDQQWAVVTTSCSDCGRYSGETFLSLHCTKEEAAEVAAAEAAKHGFGHGALVRPAVVIDGKTYVCTTDE